MRRLSSAISSLQVVTKIGHLRRVSGSRRQVPAARVDEVCDAAIYVFVRGQNSGFVRRLRHQRRRKRVFQDRSLGLIVNGVFVLFFRDDFRPHLDQRAIAGVASK